MKQFIVKCRSCGTILVARAEKEGDFVDCPHCQAVVEVRAASEMKVAPRYPHTAPIPKPKVAPTASGGMDPDIVAWALSQKAELSISLPTRAADEPDANAEQLAEIQSLGAATNPEGLKELGTWQAEAAIHRIRAEKKELADSVVMIAQAEQVRRNVNGCVGALIFVGLIALIIWFLR